MGFKPPYYLGIDLGGTNVKAGVVDDQGRPLSSVSVPTEAHLGPEPGIGRLVEAGQRALREARLEAREVQAVGVGSPGPMDLKKQIIINPHNLPGWLNLPLAQLVGDRLGLKGVLQNDANAAAFGEYWAGAGRGVNSLVQFTLGTGIGCGIVVNGWLLEGEHSHGAECGHLRISLTESRRHGTGLYGSLETYASAPAVVDRALAALANGMPSSLTAFAGPQPTLTSKEVFEHAEAGDPLAERLVEETAYYLAIGAVNLMHTIDPDIVLFSGGMIAAGARLLEKIRRHVKLNALPVPGEQTRIEYAQLGLDAGFIGAAGCARAKFGPSR